MAAPADRPLVGVGVLVLREGRVLLGRRRGAHGEGTWSPPGGHLERGETPEMCARRETREEAGLDVCGLRAGPWTNDIFAAEDRHYVTIWILADAGTGAARVMEPDKCDAWQWFEWHALPAPLFLPLLHLREQGFAPDR